MNSPMVGLLLRAGGIIYVKTHLPQTMMTCDSSTKVFGRACNPYSRFLTAGGSCGGEGALIAMRGSILGVGTDVGGSTRIPSFCCGITGFKALVERLPFAGQTPPGRPGLAGGIAVALVPLCTSLRDAELFFPTIMSCRLVQRIWMTTLWDPCASNRHRRHPSLRLGFFPRTPTSLCSHPCTERSLPSPGNSR
jgi:Asp-tRNA(Asn)/Glu-tRNA(Gln) amidotransferase A subunit family amidase